MSLGSLIGRHSKGAEEPGDRRPGVVSPCRKHTYHGSGGISSDTGYTSTNLCWSRRSPQQTAEGRCIRAHTRPLRPRHGVRCHQPQSGRERATQVGEPESTGDGKFQACRRPRPARQPRAQLVQRTRPSRRSQARRSYQHEPLLSDRHPGHRPPRGRATGEGDVEGPPRSQPFDQLVIVAEPGHHGQFRRHHSGNHFGGEELCRGPERWRADCESSTRPESRPVRTTSS